MALTVNKWANVAVAVQSALAATKTISAITKANPGVATSTAHGYTNGQEVSLSILGMSQLNNRPVRVANVAANTFELEGIDTTIYDTFSSGTAALITFGTTMSTLTDVTASGGDSEMIDITTIHDNIKSQIPGTPNPATFSFESIWDVLDAGLLALKSAADAQASRVIRFTFLSGAKFYFNGFIACSLIPTGSAQGVVKTPVAITAFGRAQAYGT